MVFIYSAKKIQGHAPGVICMPTLTGGAPITRPR